ncbi:MAG TPA: B12-binding domain-containing radical SAM protein [Xanthobacteraceae bacterium]|nr:B12-binding domain-containing radical SAM protein [Xanthobacteraceae bacterium]
MRETNASRPTKALLIYPRFNGPSFWNYRATCELLGARYPAAPLGLMTVAALLPQDWDIRLIDRNVQPLDVADIDRADIVMAGGMLPQQRDLLQIIDLCRARGKPIVVGGPDVTSSPHIYERADFQVLGEAESVLPAFIAAWNSGARRGVFEAEKFQADVTKSPAPRFDLIRFQDYLFIGVQFSRGCPFNCEFCDIIELYGRVPRTKTAPQMLAELEALYRLGYRGHVDFSDDNLIGNKKALRLFLPHLKAWQEAHGFPFMFSTEASINLADDDALLAIMRDCNFFTMFVGIESPDPETLVAMQKKQNTRRSLADSVHKIYQAGIFVNAGFILGFDTEKAGTAQEIVNCIEATSIPVSLVGLLYALPNTQLTRRLQREGRLYSGHDTNTELADQCVAGLNFVTARPRRDLLADYLWILDRVYRPAAYFGRVRRVGRALRPPSRGGAFSWKGFARDLAQLGFILGRMSLWRPRLTLYFFGTVIDCAARNPGALENVMAMISLYLHLGPFAREVAQQIQQQIDDIDAGKWAAPPLLPPEPALAGPRPILQAVS